MMKLKIFTSGKVESGEIELPVQFAEPVRPDLIKRAVHAIQAGERQAYGAFERAGKDNVSWTSKRRREWRTSYGHGIARTPRKVVSRRGSQFNWIGAFAPNTVGGRRAHPAKAGKDWEQKINKKERRKAIRSAIAATIFKDMVMMRGHRIPQTYPFVLDSKFENIAKTGEVFESLDKLGFTDELQRTSEKTVRAGRGKSRGRPYQKKTGPLIVVSKDCPALLAARNIPGVDVIVVSNLNASLLAPGTHPGRATIFTTAAIDRLKNERLFTDNPVVQAKPELKKVEAKAVVKKPMGKK